MSKTTKKKHVTHLMNTKLVLPSKNEVIARILASKGRYLLEVHDCNNGIYLASMPVKFRNTIWVIRGSFVILELVENGKKVKAEITHILNKENILYIKEQGLWPKRFEHDVELMTRRFNQNEKKNSLIDADLLPSSDEDLGLTENDIGCNDN